MGRDWTMTQSEKAMTGGEGLDDIQKELAPVLARLFEIMYPLVVLFGGIALTASVYRSIQYGWYGTLSLHAGVYLAALALLFLRRRLPVIFLFSVMLGLIFVEVVHALYYRGLASAGMMNLAILTVFTGIFLGKRVGIMAATVGALVASLLAVGYCTGRLTMSLDGNEYFVTPIAWIINISCFIMYVVPLILMVNVMQRRIAFSLRELKNTASSLEAEIAARKQVEEELRKSEENYRSIFNNAIMGIFRSSPEGRFLCVNAAFARRIGFESPEELMTTVADIGRQLYVNPEERKRLSERLSAEGMVEGFEIQVRHRSGHSLWVLANVTDVRDEDGKTRYYEGTVQDITDRKRAEAALRESEAILRQVIDLVPHFIFAKDREGRFIMANQAVADAYGTTVEAITGKTDADFNPSASEVEHFVGDDARVIDSGTIMEIPEETITDARGQVRILQTTKIPFKVSGTGDAVLGVCTDITDRKSAERALQESEAKYRSVVESSLAGFYIIQDDLLRFVNHRFCEITGYTYAEAVDRMPFLDLIHPDDQTRVAENAERRLKGELRESENEFRAIKKDGSVITVKVFGGTSMLGGRPALCGTFVDNTREQILESQLRQAQKMEAIGTLAGGIAHDFNNILTALIGYGTILQSRMEENDPLRLYAELILSASHKAVDLTQSLLTFGRKRPLSLKPVDLNTIINGTEKLLKRLITEDIILETQLAESELVVMADITQIDQILFNLTTNARDAMPRGGTLTITTGTAMLDNNFIMTHGFGECGRYALLSISDTGLGMGKEILDKIYDPFFTTKEVGRGTGLGLSNVYGIVKQHRGYITVESERDRGTTFHIYLPAARTAAEEERSEAVAFQGGRETILMAEDNEDVRRFVTDLLSGYGYTVIEAVDGEDAVAKFQAHQDIALVILDSIMPKLNGREAYDAIRSLQPATSFLFMSGYTADIVLEKGVGKEEFAFISKPLEPKAFLAKIREILDREK